MNPQTMILSLLLSRWKHMVCTSASLASLQMSRFCARQKALVHCEQDPLAARGATFESLFSWRTPNIGTASRGAKRELADLRSEAAWSSVLLASSRGTIVLFLKQLHLQKDGAAFEG